MSVYGETRELPRTDDGADLGLELIHVWEPDATRALCGSRHVHLCPESASGNDIAMLTPGSTRCWCGNRLCGVCLWLWREANARGYW